MKKIGLQLYSVKEATAKDFMGTLEKVAKMGYTGVEFAGFAGISAEDMKAKLDELGLEAAGSHVSIMLLRDNIDEIIKYHKMIGCKYIIVPYANMKTKEEAEALREEFVAFSEKLAEHGMIFGYHNHAHEMEVFEGEYGLDIMLKDERLIYEVDTFWTEYAKVDTKNYLSKIGRRCPLVHLKDMDESGKSTIFGAGILDNQKIVNASVNYCNPEWYIIEWEGFGSCDCMYAVEESINNLKKLL